MVINSLKHDGQEYTEEIMRRCGFTKSEIAKYIVAAKQVGSQGHTQPVQHTHVHMQPAPEMSDSGRAFVGTGYKLVTTPVAAAVVTQTSSNNYKIEVDPSLPQTAIKVRLFDGNQITVNANHETTVEQLILHVRSSSNLAPGAQFTLKNTAAFPPQVLSQPSLTIKAANLLNGSVVQSLTK